MKKNEAGDFAVIYVEPGDERTDLIQVISGQKKPVILMLSELARTFQRPDDFATLKHVKRQLDLSIIFVIPNSSHLSQLAARNGFPVYLSMDTLTDALSVGQLVRQRNGNKVESVQRAEVVNRGSVDALKRISVPDEVQPAQILKAPRPKTSEDFANLEDEPSEPLQDAVKVPHRPTNVGQRSSYSQHSPLTTAPLQPAALPQLKRLVAAASPADTLFASQTVTSPLEQLSVKQSRDIPTVANPDQNKILPLEPRPTSLKPNTGMQKKRSSFFFILLGLACTVIFGGLGAFLMMDHFPTSTSSHTAPIPVSSTLGHVMFTSSEQLNENTSQGIEDQVTIDLNHLANPAAQKKDYAWLLSDKNQSDPKTIALGALDINKGQAHLFYAGDTQHSNLLLVTSRFLVTEEDATVQPIAPSPDMSTWRYYGEFSTAPIVSPDNPNHFSYLDHLRHLLGADPTLEELQLPGGLNNWFYSNTGKILEWAGSTRGQWQDTKDAGFVRRQSIRVLQYLDGNSFVYKDLPANTPLLVNERLSRVGLLDINGPNQEPPCYLTHIVRHINGLLQASAVPETLSKNAAELTTALNNVQFWLAKVRQDALQLVNMDDQQLQQPGTLSLLNDMIDNANHAYTGQLDPSTNAMREGAVWIHDHMQTLAMLDVTHFTAVKGSIH